MFHGRVFVISILPKCFKRYVFNDMHYDYTSMQYTAIFQGSKNGKLQMKNCDIYLIFAQKLDREYTLEPSY